MKHMTPQLRAAIRTYNRAWRNYNATKQEQYPAIHRPEVSAAWIQRLDALELITAALRDMFPDNEEARATISKRISKAAAPNGEDAAFWRRITRPACPWLPHDTASLDPAIAYRACKNYYGF